MAEGSIIEIFSKQIGGDYIFLNNHQKGVIEKINSFEQNISFDLDNFDDFFGEAGRSEPKKSPNYIAVRSGLTQFLKLKKGVTRLLVNVNEILNIIVSESYKSLNSDESPLDSTFWSNFETLSVNINRFQNYVLQKNDAIKLATDFGLAQSTKTLAWHAATELKAKFSNYSVEANSLNRELSHILTSMKREIKNSIESKPKENTDYDEFNVKSDILELQQQSKQMFNEDLTPEEQKLKFNNKIKQKNKENQLNTQKLSEISTSDSFVLEPPSKAAKKVEFVNQENDEMKAIENFQCKEKNCQTICKNAYELNRHIKKKHTKEKESMEKLPMLPIQ